jgi:DNA-binding CsgD family transcriptional regulator
VNPAGIEALSVQEFAVALAAVERSCGQKQFARQMGMTEDAVRQTLGRVYRKLQITSRLELRDVWVVR